MEARDVMPIEDSDAHEENGCCQCTGLKLPRVGLSSYVCLITDGCISQSICVFDSAERDMAVSD